MQSDAKTVAEYMKTVPKERQAALKKIRKLARASLKGYKESMQYGGPTYSRNGVAEVGFFSQKHFIGVYVLNKEVLDKHRHEFTGASVGKGAIRYSNPDKIDFDLIKRVFEETSASDSAICP